MVEEMTLNLRPNFCNILLQYVFFEKRISLQLQIFYPFSGITCAQDEFSYLICEN